MMTLSEKLRALAIQADAGRESEVYSTLAIMLTERPWPSWLKRVAEDIDGPKISKDMPINLQEAA